MAMKRDEALGPADVRPFRSQAVVTRSKCACDLFEQARTVIVVSTSQFCGRPVLGVNAHNDRPSDEVVEGAPFGVEEQDQ
jgi:hypothetical protein